MIQRIQTLYLFLADLLIGVLLIVPFAELSGKDGIIHQFKISGVEIETVGGGAFQSSWPLLALVGILLLSIIIVIFQYKNRKLQKKLSYLVLFLLVALTALMFFNLLKINNVIGGSYELNLFFSFPMIAAVFVYLAIRGISRDENLVKSIDRIR